MLFQSLGQEPGRNDADTKPKLIEFGRACPEFQKNWNCSSWFKYIAGTFNGANYSVRLKAHGLDLLPNSGPYIIVCNPVHNVDRTWFMVCTTRFTQSSANLSHLETT
jgi:hypothetical protein